MSSQLHYRLTFIKRCQTRKMSWTIKELQRTASNLQLELCMSSESMIAAIYIHGTKDELIAERKRISESLNRLTSPHTFPYSFEQVDAEGNSFKCSHHHRSLRGCTCTKGHIGPHFNRNSADGFKWEDADGVYINNQQDWSNLVRDLGEQRV
jgi:hypothetical protein